jgi:two-component system, chemotaxis family, protein-glutamate methylesterase/glutaminase
MGVKDEKIKVFIVEDSAVQRECLMKIFNSDPAIQVIGVAQNGIEAITALEKIRPHVVVMDLHMPRMNGIEAIHHIMTTHPLPIVAVSASDREDGMINSFNALKAGAVAFSEKPTRSHDPQYESNRSYLLRTVKLMSEVKVIRRIDDTFGQSQSIDATKNKKNVIQHIPQEIQLIAIGVSTGGPLTLEAILSRLPSHFPPILIVQHIAPGFIQGFAEWLTHMTNHDVRVAKSGELPESGHIYLAPDHYQMGLSNNGCIALQSTHAKHEFCPSVNFLFHSVAQVIKDKAIGILLTGMGTDGASELKSMKEKGAITIAQDEETSLIYGMPNQAVAIGAATYILTPAEIAETIAHLTLSRDQ